MYNLDDEFKRLLPKYNFKLKDFQKSVINNVLEHGNTLCIMQTGGGKSIIYCLTGLLLHGITLVISPLTALINEQIDKIKDNGYEAIAFPGNMSPAKQAKLLKQLANKEYNPDFIFVSPEKIGIDGLLEYALLRRNADIKLIAIDEIHCVSQWGISFRPFYDRIPEFITNVFGSYKNVKVLGLTATLNPKERIDICKSFYIEKENIKQQNLMLRHEIRLCVYEFNDEVQKEEKFWNLLAIHKGEKTLVYVYRKYSVRSVEGLWQEAISKGYNACSFHGDMSAEERKEIIERFRNGDVDIVFATNAFGMGIDIKDIRVVIHFMIPESLEQYYQEVGRAARDGNAANAYLLYTNKNIEVKRKYFIDGSFPSEEKLRKVYNDFTNKEIGYKTKNYFADEDIQQCLPYFIEAGLISIECKGFDNLKKLINVQSPTIQSYLDATKTKNFTSTVKKAKLAPKVLAQDVYQGFVDGKVEFSSPLERWIVINILASEISEQQMDGILNAIEEKKRYKHELLDYFVYVIKNVTESKELHQEIGNYLGVDRFGLNRIYKTADDNLVRSKSEVIISDLLYKDGIEYQYEEKLYYGSEGKNTQFMIPDFTVKAANGNTYYWEHIGMLGLESYDARWLEKRKIYEQYFPGKLIYTYESGNIAMQAAQLIEAKLKDKK